MKEEEKKSGVEEEGRMIFPVSRCTHAKMFTVTLACSAIPGNMQKLRGQKTW